MNEARSPDQIERDITELRNRISDTIDAVQDRLSPGELLDQMLNLTKEEGGAMIEGCARVVRRNPLPVALIGTGLAWLLYASNRPDPPQAAPIPVACEPDPLETARETVRNTAHAGATMVRDNPWRAIALGLGVGAIVGALLTPSRRRRP